MSLALLAQGLLTAGPAIIRGVGSLFSGEKAELANRIASAAQIAAGATSPQVKMEHELKGLTPEQIIALKEVNEQAQVELARIEQQREARAFENTETLHQQTQQTIQNGDNATDEYVRRTRPHAARVSLYGTLGYVLVMEICSAFNYGSGASWELAGVLFGPLLTYMGVRTAEAFSKFKGPKL